MIKLPKRTINVLIILTTLVAVVYYFSHHASLLTSLKHIDPITGIIVLGLYCLMLVVLVFVLSATLNLVDLKLKFGENLLLNAYSIFINFFIPGQAGTVYRGYYLYKNHKLKVINYTIATVIYYVMYALLSVVMLSVGSQKWWVSLCLFIFVTLLAALGTSTYLSKFKNSPLRINFSTLGFLALMTLVQAIVQITIYFVELHSVNHGIKLSQAITYTGAANIALFVALTPAAIGIRESFLILSEKLNHVSTGNIVLANVIDRSVFIIFLLIIGLVILIIKSTNHLKNFSLAKNSATETRKL